MVKLKMLNLWFYMILYFCMMMMLVTFFFIKNEWVILLEYNMMKFNPLKFVMIIIFDKISLPFITTVLFISSMVLNYSSEYMGEQNYMSNRFLIMLILFISSMVLMILSPNLISIMLGWDGLGLTSYCLVMFYMSNKSYQAGKITFLLNRLGDIGILISICWMMSYGSWNFMFYSNKFSNLLFVIMVISAFTKSAQIPFSSWLTAAMAAPTPVSSLVHSSTLVTAGVYIMMRFHNNMFFKSSYLMILTLMTLILASFCASFEYDLKKIIALSTLSQLGLMMMTLFLGMKELTMFHLITHAMFKSLLFLCSGMFIFFCNDSQDIRSMGSICKMMPFSSACFNIANMAMCGMPFLSGFYSKDLIFEFMVQNNLNSMTSILLYFSLALTSCYSMRLLMYTSLFNSKNKTTMMKNKFIKMNMSILLITILSVILGSIYLWNLNLKSNLAFLPPITKMTTLIIVTYSLWLTTETMNKNKILLESKFNFFNMNMWCLFKYSSYMIKMILINSMFLNKIINMGWGETYGAQGLNFIILKTSLKMQNYMNNMMMTFLMFFIMWMMITI